VYDRDVVQDIRPDTGSAVDEDASARKGKQFVKGPTKALRAEEEEEETESSEEEEVSSKQKGRAKGLGGQGQQKARQAPARPDSRPDSRPPVEENEEDDMVQTFAPRPTQRRQGGFFDESPQSQGPQKSNIDSKKFFGDGAGKVTRGGFAPQDDSDDGIETIQTVEVAKPQAKKSAPRQKPKWSRPIGDDVASFDDSDDLDAEEA
jgi:hypothetical protein